MALLKDGTRIYGNAIVDGNIAVSEIYSGGNTWTFGTDGTLTFPSGNLTINPGTDYFGSRTVLVAAADGLPLVSQSSGNTGVITSLWLENLADPFHGNVAAVYANPIPGSGVVRVTTGIPALGNNIWDFGINGELTLPANGIINNISNSSGDGYGYSTLQLIPDNNLVSGGQYLIVDPTSGGHIHIRAGGTQDDSPATLILGGENSNFMVWSGANPQVNITANNNVWTFGTDGALTLPTPGIIVYGDGSQQNTAYLISRSGFDVATPAAVLDNIQIGINIGWQPYITCVNVGTANIGVSTSFISNGGTMMEVESMVLTLGLYSYFFGGALTYANPNETLTATIADFDGHKTYSATWYATSAGQGYVSIQQI